MRPARPLTRLLPPALRSIVPSRPASDEARRLADILQVEVGELAAVRMGPRYHYRPAVIAKPDGRRRRLLAPSPGLKTLQRRLLDRYLSHLPVHECATAFRPGSSAVENARAHARNWLIATVDLRDFFESTRAARVRAFFVRHGWRGEGLQALMRLCAFRNGLPQGAPTSPCLSNLVNVSLDQRLHALARRSGATYTRYADDLAFSWDADRMPGGFPAAVEDTLHAAGYEVQPCKGWRVSPVTARPCVTGVVLRGNGRLSIPWALRCRIWGLRWRAWWSADDRVRARVRGYTAYARAVR